MNRIAPVILSLYLLLVPKVTFGLNPMDSLLEVAQSGGTQEAALAYKQLAILSVDSLDLYLTYASSGFEIAHDLEDDLLCGNLLMNMGVASDMHGQFDQAILYYDSAAVFLERGNFQDWLTTLNINYGSAYYFAGFNHLALDYWLKAYDLSKKDGSDENYPVLLNNIAQIYMEVEQYPEAIKYYEESLKLKREQSSYRRLINTLNNLGRLYQLQGHYSRALDILEEARQISRRENDTATLQVIEVSMAETYLKKGDLSQAKSLIIPHWQNDFEGNLKDSRVSGYLATGELFNQMGEYANAAKAFLMSRDLGGNSMAYVDHVRLLEGLADSYHQQGDYSAALKEQQELNELQKTKMKDNRLALEEEMQVKFNTLRKEEENALLREQSSLKDELLIKSRRNFWLVILVLLIVSGFAVQIYLSQKKVNSLVETLREQKQKLSKSLEERELLLREIHHRVKNNLQFISSLLSLQSQHVADPTAFEALQSGQDRVRSMALIHQNLYQDESLTGVAIKDYFTKLTRNLFDSYNISPERIQLKMDVDDVNLDVDTVVPLGLIVNELISNALKHAFPTGQKGIIEIALKEDGQVIKLEVRDNGVGMATVDKEKLLNSFGYRLIHAFKEQLGAEVEIINQKGTTVQLSITDYQKVA